MAIRQYALAKAIGVPPQRINEIVKGLRGIAVSTALRLSVLLAPMRKAGAIFKPTTTRNMPALLWLAYWAASCCVYWLTRTVPRIRRTPVTDHHKGARDGQHMVKPKVRTQRGAYGYRWLQAFWHL